MHMPHTEKWIVFRTDSSYAIGSGHVMRCLTLADSIRKKEKVKIAFICRELPGNMCSYIEKNGYLVSKLPYRDNSLLGCEDQRTQLLGEKWQVDAEQTKQLLQIIARKPNFQWLIVDHYSLDLRWEYSMRNYVQKIMVIDDLADRAHDCDLLLDQNLYIDMQTRYLGLIPRHCKTFLGPRYALLRPEFYDAVKRDRVRNGKVNRIIVFFGGSDLTNETAKALQAIQLLNRKDIIIDVVVGEINPHKDQILRLCNEMPNTNFFCQVNNIAELMSNADLAIGAGGASTWERCILGLPSLTIIVAENQVKATGAVAKVGAIVSLGWHSDVSILDINKRLGEIINSPKKIKKMSIQALNLNVMQSSNAVDEYIVDPNTLTLRSATHAKMD